MTPEKQTYLERKARKNWRNNLRWEYTFPCAIRLESEIIDLASKGESLDNLIEWYDDRTESKIPFTSAKLPIYPILIVAKVKVGEMIRLPKVFMESFSPRLFNLSSCHSCFEVFGYHPSSDNGGYCRSQLSSEEYNKAEILLPKFSGNTLRINPFSSEEKVLEEDRILKALKDPSAFNRLQVLLLKSRTGHWWNNRNPYSYAKIPREINYEEAINHIFIGAGKEKPSLKVEDAAEGCKDCNTDIYVAALSEFYANQIEGLNTRRRG